MLSGLITGRNQGGPSVGAAAAYGSIPIRPGLVARLRESLANGRDPIFVDLGATGELAVARVRILLLCILLTIQI
ncbi:MAG: hypothetical protein HYS36_10480, partial [Candidatus Rokubacteria bacterium]|nr:hypothetical protein [Candidatus Rokubacteria bacterium]